MKLAVLVVCILWPAFGRADRFYVRAGIAYIEPNLSAHGFKIDSSGLAALAMLGPIDGGVAASTAMTPTAIIGVVLRDRLSIETIVGLPMTIKLTAYGALATKSLAPTVLGFIPTGIPPLGTELGDASALAPIVTLVYRLDNVGPFVPFVGVGASTMFVTGVHVTNPVLTAVSSPTMQISSSIGGVLQAALELKIWHAWYARLDVKYIAFTDSQATIENIQVHTTIPLLTTVSVGSASLDVSASPVIVQAGVGASF